MREGRFSSDAPPPTYAAAADSRGGSNLVIGANSAKVVGAAT